MEDIIELTESDLFINGLVDSVAISSELSKDKFSEMD